MAAPQRLGAPAKKGSMRPPPSRQQSAKNLTAATLANGRVSPAESILSSRQNLASLRSPPTSTGLKRKDRDFEQDGGEETNINVVVRCRGRSDREVRENSGVVVSTDGVKGKTVELSMGPNALSNKTYNFDRVFSPAADQSMVFQEVVAPIVEEVLSGFNCTIFAYGQTGTGKTYTMSGDITEMPPLPDEAGIIPRVLFSLFDKLEAEDQEHCVKCSFIELYNEELRDLIASDENHRLKIFDDANRKSQSATVVQGMEETHIKNATRGVELLREGNRKRQVAATKCNDLSSRSHTVFTITIYTKRVADGTEDFVSAGKLNLVDLAGSENIQRSGAENKRAAEAGLINKSLLTLGRVINALVDRSSHIPYRESKLTRLLQDSLGGRTKTCIIATLSPAKSNLEETISTLDYAFRAKNIRNKPQMNQLISKKTLFREFSTEIEKLKSELIATRHRNGVYLSSENYEEITTESESRRILSEEQRDKIETMESNLRNKAQELFSLTTSFSNLKKDNEAVKAILDGTKDVLEKTETVLAHTRQELAEETVLRKAHQDTEGRLLTIGNELITTLGKTTNDIGGLHSKLRRRSALQSLNRTNWAAWQGQISETTTVVQERMKAFEERHQNMLTGLAERLRGFMQQENANLANTRSLLQEKSISLDDSERQANEQTAKAREDMDRVLREIQILREDVKHNVGTGLQGLSAAAQRISDGVIAELEIFHSQLHSSYSALGKEFKNVFDSLTGRLQDQQNEIAELRKQLSTASTALVRANDEASTNLETILHEEKQKAAADRTNLIAQMSTLIRSFGEEQEKRIESKIGVLQTEIANSKNTFQEKEENYNASMDAWSAVSKSILDDLLKSRESVKAKVKNDWSTANEHNSRIQSTTRAVHEETVQVVETQMKQMDTQLQSLDGILTKVQEQNGLDHEAHLQSTRDFNNSVKESFSNIGGRFESSSEQLRAFETDLTAGFSGLGSSLEPLQEAVHAPLAVLRSDVMATSLTEYVPTGETPQKMQYEYASSLPRTREHEKLLDRFRHPTVSPMAAGDEDLNELAELNMSPSKGIVYADIELSTEGNDQNTSSPVASRKDARTNNAQSGLRELDINVAASNLRSESAQSSHSSNDTRSAKGATDGDKQPPLKKQNTGGSGTVTVPARAEIKDFSASVGSKPVRKAVVAEGRENLPLGGSVGPGTGRVLRNRGS